MLAARTKHELPETRSPIAYSVVLYGTAAPKGELLPCVYTVTKAAMEICPWTRSMLIFVQYLITAIQIGHVIDMASSVIACVAVFSICVWSALYQLQEA